MTENIDDLTITYQEGDKVLVKELDKIILSRGAWSTILFRHQDWNNAKEAYGPDKYTIRRYQKRGGQYQMRSKFTISSVDQAEKIISALQGWIKSDGG